MLRYWKRRFLANRETAFSLNIKSIKTWDRAIAQAVSRRVPTAAAHVRAQVRSCGIFGGQIGNPVGFLRVFRFPLPILITPTAPHSSSITRGWYNRPKYVSDVPSGLSLTPRKHILTTAIWMWWIPVILHNWNSLCFSEGYRNPWSILL
jgi:hypothetical protein